MNFFGVLSFTAPYLPWVLLLFSLLLGNNAIFWRLITSFCFFGSFGFSFLFNMIFTYRYCMMLEEGSFRGLVSWSKS
ncbi:hypothetical protein OSTOST_09555 [Ostertagia ostertagi]